MDDSETKKFQAIVDPEISRKDDQIAELQDQLSYERDARKEDRFAFILGLILLLNVVFFSIMPSFGGPLALLILELLVLIPLARRMGMEEVATILSRVLHRMSGRGDEE